MNDLDLDLDHKDHTDLKLWNTPNEKKEAEVVLCIRITSTCRHHASMCLFFLDVGHDAVAIRNSIQFHIVSYIL